MSFQNSILGGTALVRPAIKSPNYVLGAAGWSINQDGSAEFNNLTSRGIIVVGPTSGEIDVYDALGNLFIKISPGVGIQVFDTAAKLREVIAVPGLFSEIDLYAADAAETQPAKLRNSHQTGDLLTFRTSDMGHGSLSISLWSMPNIGDKTVFQFDTSFMGGTGGGNSTGPVVIDACGDGTKPAKFVASDIWVGTGTSFGNPPTEIQSIGRGVLTGGYQRLTANDVARAAGVNTDMALTVTVDNTRLYRVHLKSAFNLGTVGVTYAIDLSEAGTVGTNNGTIIDRWQRWNASESATNVLHVDSALLYAPATSGVKTLRVRNDGGSGGTIQLAGAVGIERQFWIEDIGAQ